MGRVAFQMTSDAMITSGASFSTNSSLGYAQSRGFVVTRGVAAVAVTVVSLDALLDESNNA